MIYISFAHLGTLVRTMARSVSNFDLDSEMARVGVGHALGLSYLLTCV